LRATFDAVVRAWHVVCKDRAVRAFRVEHDHWGFLRTTEVNYGFANGWHPHGHWLDLWGGQLSPAEVIEWESLVFAAWRRGISKLGLPLPDREHGVRIVSVRNGGVGDYVTDMTSMSAGQELTALSTKRARGKNLGPFDLLRGVADFGGSPWIDLWWEYEQTTRGRRMFSATPHLLRRLGLPDDDPVPVEAGSVIAAISFDEWNGIRARGNHYGAQAAIEAAASAGGFLGVREAVRLLLGGERLVMAAVADEQLTLGPGDDGGFF